MDMKQRHAHGDHDGDEQAHEAHPHDHRGHDAHEHGAPGHGRHDHDGADPAPSARKAHGHPHGPDGHGHGDHGGGVLGWLAHTFGHSHSTVDKIDDAMESHERGIQTLKVTLVALLITAALQLVVVLISGSVSLLADMIHNFGDATTSIPLWVAFTLARRGASRRFTYGYGRTEDVAGVAIVGIIFFSACVAAFESAMKIIHPQPMQHLAAVATAAVIGFVGNEAVAVVRIRTGNEIGSAALVADGMHARVDGFTSLAVLVAVVGAWLGYPVVDPIVGILITIAILFIVKDAARSVWNRLIEGIEPEILAEVEHGPMHVPGVLGVRNARARWVGHRVFADLHVAVDPEMSVRDAHAVAEAVEAALRDHVPTLGDVVVHVYPTGSRTERTDGERSVAK